MSLPADVFAGTLAAWQFMIATLGRTATFVQADGTELPITCGLAKPYRADVIQAYGETARVLTLRAQDLGGHEPQPFELVRHNGADYVIAEVAAVWINSARVGWRCIAHGRP